MKVLVTGDKGFVGKAFCEKLEKEKVEYVGYDLPDKNILNYQQLYDEVGKCDCVVHFAAIANLNDSLVDMDKNFDVNVHGTYIISKICRDLNKRLVFISTCCVYGNTVDDVQTEDGTLPKTDEPYATSKMAGEYIIRGTPALQYTVLRIGTVYGPNMRRELFNFIALDKAMSGEMCKVHGTGRQTRDYIYIDDLVDGIYLSLKMFPICLWQTINLCGNERISVNDTIDVAEAVTGKKINSAQIKDRLSQIYEEKISIEKAEKILNWQPKVKFVDGMEKTFAWFMENNEWQNQS